MSSRRRGCSFSTTLDAIPCGIALQVQAKLQKVIEEDAMAPEAQKVMDPVCGMMIDPSAAAAKRTWDGRDFYFCGMGCARAFDSNPEEFGLEEA